ncbi:MAG: hypothetical protein U7127_27200 [Phormidium sp.]
MTIPSPIYVETLYITSLHKYEDGKVIGATVTINRTGLVDSAGTVEVLFANGTATGGGKPYHFWWW